jgi:hypothetical protein
MTILLSQLFSPATLVADTLVAPDAGASGEIVIARPRGLRGISHFVQSGTAGDRLLDAVFWLRPSPEERPYAL